MNRKHSAVKPAGDIPPICPRDIWKALRLKYNRVMIKLSALIRSAPYSVQLLNLASSCFIGNQNLRAFTLDPLVIPMALSRSHTPPPHPAIPLYIAILPFKNCTDPLNFYSILSRVIFLCEIIILVL